MSYRRAGAMEKAVQAALTAKAPVPCDAAIASLAQKYARLLDAAAPAARYSQALQWLERLDTDDPDAERHVRLIAAALAEHSVASDLGPKLVSALEALQMSPRARTAAHRGEVKDAPATASRLDQLAAARARKSPTGDLDAGTS